MKRILQKGFTLIELLIVIAIIGVLATVVLLAIDPLEQLDRGRDAGRKTGLAQVSHAIEAWATAQSAVGDYPKGGDIALGVTLGPSNFQTFLKSAGEIKNVVQTTNRINPACTGSTSTEGGFCYNYIGTTNFVAWVTLDSKSEKSKAGCTAAQFPVAAYYGTQGRAGVGCTSSATTVPAEGTLKF